MEKVNLSVADQTRNKLTQVNARNLVSSACHRENAFQHWQLIPALLDEFPIGSTGRESAGSRVRAEEVQRLVGALKTKLGSTYDDLVNRETSFYGFDPDAPVKRHDNWRGTEQAKKYISELLNKNGIY